MRKLMCIKSRLVKHYVINNFEIGIKCQFNLEKLKYKYVIDSFLWKRIKADSIQYLPSLKSYFTFRSVVTFKNYRNKDITFFQWVKTILWMSINTFVDVDNILPLNKTIFVISITSVLWTCHIFTFLLFESKLK